jgi:hypothetical protein
MSVIYKCSIVCVLTFKVAAYVQLCDLLWLGLMLGSCCGSSGVRVGGGGVFSWWGFTRESQRLCWGIWCVCHFSGGCYGILYKSENVLLY